MELQTWEPSFQDNKHFAMIISSARRSGKSYLVRHLYTDKWDGLYDLVVVMTTDVNRDYYSEFIPGTLIFSDYQSDKISDLVQIQNELLIEKGRMLDVLIILDDIVGKDVKASEDMLKLFCTGRHNNLAIVLIIQDLTLCKTVLRDNCDYFICFKQKSARSRELITDQFLCGIYDEDEINDGKSEKTFIKKIMKDTCVKYQAIVVDYINGDETLLLKYRAP